MTQDEIIEMAKKAGIPTTSRFVGGEVVECLTVESQAFAKLVAAKEREEWQKEFAGLGEWTAVHILEARGEA